MRKPLFWIIYLGWILSITGLKGQQLSLESIIATYDGVDRPAYRIKVPADESSTKAAIRSHLQTARLQAVWHSGWWESRNVIYPPVSNQQKISLAYATRPDQDSTAIIFVALNSQGNAITPENSPGLSYRLLKDFAQLSESLAESEVRFAHLFNELSTKEPPDLSESEELAVIIDLQGSARSDLNNSPSTPPSEPEDPASKQSELIQAYQDTILILKDGIYGYEILLQEQQAFIDTLLRGLKRKPKSYSRVNSSASAKTSSVTSKDLAQLQDSLSHWKKSNQAKDHQVSTQAREIDSLLNLLQAAQKNTSPPLVSPAPQIRQDSLLSYTQQSHQQERLQWQSQLALSRATYQREMKVLQERYYTLEKSYNQILKEIEARTLEVQQLQQDVQQTANRLNQAQGKAHTTVEQAGKTHRRLRTQLKINENKLEEAERQIASSQMEILRLRKALSESQSTSLTRLNDLEDVQGDLAKARMSYRGLEVEKNRRLSDLRDAEEQMDSLINQNTRLSKRNHKLILSQDSLRAEVSLLSPYSESVKARRRVYQQQLSNLTQLQQRIPQIEQDLYAREKLLKQREKLIQAQDKDGDYSAILSNLENMAAENRRLKTQKSDLAAPHTPSRLEIYSSNIRWKGSEVSVYCLDIREGELALREKIEHFFLERRQEPVQTIPLTYDRVSLAPSLTQPVRVVLDIGDPLSNGWRRVACTVLDSNGKLIPMNHPGLRAGVSQLLEEIFR